MFDNTSNPFFDAWISASEQVIKTQANWFSSFTDTDSTDTPEAASVSEVMERAKQNWDQCEAQFNSWASASEQWFSESSDESTELNNESFERFKRMLNPETFLRSGVDEINQVFKRLVEGPDFADFGVLEKKFMRTSQDWMNLRNASAEYQTVITKAWTQAFDAYVKEFSTQSKEEPVDTHAMMQRWLKIANNSLIQVQRSDEFLAAQRKLFKTNTRYKLKQREIIEAWCENFTMPTRSEVDDLHRMVYELRREVRQLKTQLKQQPQQEIQQSPPSQPPKSDTKQTEADVVKVSKTIQTPKIAKAANVKTKAKKVTKKNRSTKKRAKKTMSKKSKKTT